MTTWQGIGLFEQGALPEQPPAPLVEIADAAASVEDKARAYLHVNCSICHRPLGSGTVNAYLAVNDKGLKEFHIELKDGPLKGALLKITADDGKIALSFANLGADEKRLVEASKGELMRRLGKKGLTLSRLDVQ